MGSLRHGLGQAVTSAWFNNMSMVLVLVNMAIMTMPYESQSDDYAASLESAQLTITWIFIIEMGLKIIGLGCTGYWSDGWNQLDGTIVSFSIIEMALTTFFASAGVKLSFLRILRMLRVLRVLRLMRSWKGMYKIVITFVKAIPDMTNLFILMFLFMVIFSLLGMQIFGGVYNPSTGYSDVPCPHLRCPNPDLVPTPRWHFDYFIPAMMTVFVLMTGEWVDAMDPAVGASGYPAVFYFVAVRTRALEAAPPPAAH